MQAANGGQAEAASMSPADLPVQDAVREPAPAPAPKIEYKPRVEIPRPEMPREEPPREEPRQAETPRAEAPRAAAPQIDAREALSSAGLQMVETTKAPAPMPEPEPERLGRPRRERPAAAPSGQEELVQVETRDK